MRTSLVKFWWMSALPRVQEPTTLTMCRWLRPLVTFTSCRAVFWSSVE